MGFLSAVFRCRGAFLGATALLALVAPVAGFLFLAAVATAGPSSATAGPSSATAWLDGVVTTSSSEGGIFVFFDANGSIRFGGSI